MAEDLLPEKAVSVRERPRPEYEAPGMHMGGMRLYPQLTVGQSFDDNVFATETAEVSDRITTLGADLALRSEVGRTPWSVFGGVTSDSYADNSDEDYTDWQGGASIAHAIGRGTRASLTASVAHNHESRGDPSFPAAAVEPPAFETDGAQLEITHTFASGILKFAGGFETLDFNDALLVDGTIADQDFRDRDAWNAELRSDFAVGRTTALFLRALHAERDYRSGATASRIDRDSSSDALLTGASFRISNLMRGEIGVGVLEVDNRDPAQADRRSAAVSSQIEFFVTQLMTATLDVQRTSGAADVAGSASYVATRASLEVDYELRRNFILSAKYSRSQRAYAGIDRDETLRLSEIGAQWLLNRRARLNLGYAIEDRTWLFAGQDYTQQVFSANVVFAL